MLNNLLVILITLLILGFIALLWLRQNLLSELAALKHRQDLMMKDFEKRRDQVPLLLESIREMEEPSDTWRKLITDRAAFHTQTSYAAEEQFGSALQAFLNQTQLRSLHFLEVKKGIEDSTHLLEKEKEELALAVEKFNAKRKEFPYSIASAIFHFQDQQAL